MATGLGRRDKLIKFNPVNHGNSLFGRLPESTPNRAYRRPASAFSPPPPSATPTNFHSAKSAKSNLNIYAQILFKAKRAKPNKIK